MDVRYRHVLRAATDRLLAGIPGVLVGPVTISRAGTPDATVQVSVTGWGPSLHLRDRVYRVSLAQALLRAERMAAGEPRRTVEAEMAAMHPFEFPQSIEQAIAKGTPEIFGAAVAGHLTGSAEVQAEFAEAGRLLGLERPLPVPSSKAELRIDHLMISRPLADIMVRDHGAFGAWFVLHDLVRKALREDGGSSDHGIGIAVDPGQDGAITINCDDGRPTICIERLVEPAARAAAGPSVAPVNEFASFDGHSLFLPHRIPDAIAAGASGRRVGELVGTGIASLDASTIVGAEIDHDGRTWITVESEMTTMGCLRAEGDA